MPPGTTVQRLYYRCNSADCPAKRQVEVVSIPGRERAVTAHVTGKHNHTTLELSRGTYDVAGDKFASQERWDPLEGLDDQLLQAIPDEESAVNLLMSAASASYRGLGQSSAPGSGAGVATQSHVPLSLQPPPRAMHSAPMASEFAGVSALRGLASPRGPGGPMYDGGVGSGTRALMPPKVPTSVPGGIIQGVSSLAALRQATALD